MFATMKYVWKFSWKRHCIIFSSHALSLNGPGLVHSWHPTFTGRNKILTGFPCFQQSHYLPYNISASLHVSFLISPLPNEINAFNNTTSAVSFWHYFYSLKMELSALLSLMNSISEVEGHSSSLFQAGRDLRTSID